MASQIINNIVQKLLSATRTWNVYLLNSVNITCISHITNFCFSISKANNLKAYSVTYVELCFSTFKMGAPPPPPRSNPPTMHYIRRIRHAPVDIIEESKHHRSKYYKTGWAAALATLRLDLLMHELYYIFYWAIVLIDIYVYLIFMPP